LETATLQPHLHEHVSSTPLATSLLLTEEVPEQHQGFTGDSAIVANPHLFLETATLQPHLHEHVSSTPLATSPLHTSQSVAIARGGGTPRAVVAPTGSIPGLGLKAVELGQDNPNIVFTFTFEYENEIEFEKVGNENKNEQTGY
jgi:hypothetical protein